MAILSSAVSYHPAVQGARSERRPSARPASARPVALREWLFPASTEKSDKVLKQAGVETGEKKPGPESVSQKPKRAVTGHGRHGAAAYGGARKVQVPHASLKAGDACPDTACDGKVYLQRDPGVLVRIKG